VYDAATVAQASICRLIIIVVAAALVGALTVGAVDRMPSLHLTTSFDDAVMDLIRGLIALCVSGLGIGLLATLIDHKLTEIIRIRATYNRPRERIPTLAPEN
jgi:hypothetical protein